MVNYFDGMQVCKFSFNFVNNLFSIVSIIFFYIVVSISCIFLVYSYVVNRKISE